MLDGAESRATAVGQGARSAQRKPLRLAPTGRPSLLLVANENASGLAGKRETVDRAASLIRGFGARVETRWTASPHELDEFVSEEERRVVLIGGGGGVPPVADNHRHKTPNALLPPGGGRAASRGLTGADPPAGVAAALSAFAHFEPVSIALAIDGDCELRRLG